MESTSARQELKKAHKAIATSRKTIADLEESLKRAEEQIATCTVELQAFKSLDQACKRYRLEATKSGKADPRKLPAELAAQTKAKAEAQAQLSDAEEVRSAITEELEQAQAEQEAIEARLMPMAAAVLSEELATPLAEQLYQANQRVYELTQVLGNFRVDFFAEKTGWQHLGPDIPNTKYSHGEFPHSLRPGDDMATQWGREAKKLLADPDSPIRTPGVIRPESYDWSTGQPVLRVKQQA